MARLSVRSVILDDDGWSRFARIGGAASHRPHLTAGHSSSHAEIASTNAWSRLAWGLLATASD